MKKWNYLISAFLSLPLAVLAQQVEVQVNTGTTNVTHTKVSNGVKVEVSYSSDSQDNDNKANDPSKSKTFSKSFALGSNDKVDVSNRYGSITVKTWAKSEVKMDAEISAFAKDEKEAQNLLDRVQIQADKSGNEVSYKTVLNLKGINSFGSGTRNGVRWRREVKIHITLYVPISQAINLGQSYGSIYLENHDGPTALKAQYGNVNAGNLKHENNFISVQYGKATLGVVNQAKMTLAYGGESYVKEAKNLNVTAQYSGITVPKIYQDGYFRMQYGKGLELGEVENLEFDGQYTRLNAKTVKQNAKVKMQYGSGIQIGSAGSMTLTAQYTNLNLQSLAGTFTGTVQYGKINVERLEQGVKQFNVVADYSPVNVGFASNYNASLNVSTNYGSFKYGDRVKAQTVGDSKSSTSKQYAGEVGNGSGNAININARYGSVTFK